MNEQPTTSTEDTTLPTAAQPNDTHGEDNEETADAELDILLHEEASRDAAQWEADWETERELEAMHAGDWADD